MTDETKKQPVPYPMLSPGFEAVYTGEHVDGPIKAPEGHLPCVRFSDPSGNVAIKWSVWTWVFSDQWPKEGEEWKDPEIRHINRMQTRLGRLSDDIRQIRAHIGSLVPCDNGVPVTVDELLVAIGRGKLSEPSFHNGCWMGAMWWEAKTTQPFQNQAMQIIEDVLKGYLDGKSEGGLIATFPPAEEFIRRTYEWLGPANDLTEVQRLMIDRVLLPFEFLTRRNPDYDTANKNCFGKNGRGVQLDAEIAKRAGLPTIVPNYRREYRENRQTISDPEKRDFYAVCCHIAQGLHDLSDCHHSSFRWIEGWIYGIGIGKLPDGDPHAIPTRAPGTEKERLGRLLFGYALALDKWLLNRPMQFLLLDLGHVDLGFDPRNEILRVYAHLGEERTPVKEWLAVCLWHNLMYNSIDGNPGGLASHRHKHLIESAQKKSIHVREWMDAALGGEEGKRSSC